MDTTCGCGTLLLTAHKMTGCAVAGVEFTPQMYNIAVMNATVNGIDPSGIRNGDATTEEVAEYIADTAPSVLLLNPPYETKNGCMKIVKSALDNAPKGARVAIILPDNKLDKQRGHKLLKDHTLSTIVKLPTEVFDAFVDTSIFVFEPHTPQGDTKVQAFAINNDGYQYANYNDSITLRVLEDTKVEVPVTEKGEIDYKAVRDKMRPIMEKAQTHVNQLVTQYKRYKEKK